MKVFMNMRLFMKILNKQSKKNKKGEHRNERMRVTVEGGKGDG